MNEFENIQGSLIPYDHNEVEHLMKQMLYDKGMTDVIYEGSNVSQLANVASFLISSLNINTAINLQETILPLASKRQNILFGARQLGYEPHQLKSYKYKITLKAKYDPTKTTIDPDGNEIIDTNNTEKRTLSVKRNTKFVAGEKSYYYVQPEEKIISVSNYDIQHVNDPNADVDPNNVYIELEIVEGKLTTFLEEDDLNIIAYNYMDENGVEKTQQMYIIPYKNVEHDYGLQVFLTFINEYGETEMIEYTKSDEVLIDETIEYNKNKYVRLENIILGYPEIHFEYAGLGNKIRAGTMISINVLQSTGASGVIEDDLIIDDVELSQQFEIVNQELIEFGVDWERDDDIKQNAIAYHNTANRAVTRLDYISISKRFPTIKEVDAWGGEDEILYRIPGLGLTIPIGNIFISGTPAGRARPIIEYNNGFKIDIGTPSEEPTSEIQRNWRNWYMNDDEYQELFKYLDKYRVVSMILNKRHPLYIDFNFELDIVKYDISKSVQQQHTEVFNALNSYFVNTLEKFDTEFLTSNVQRLLDKTLNYRSGININVQAQGVLCEQMIEEYYYNNYNKNYIIVSLGYPYENITKVVNDVLQIDLDYIPVIDTQDFGYEEGELVVNYNDLNDTIINPTNQQIKTARIYYISPDNTQYEFGKYIIDLEKKKLELMFDFVNFNPEVIFGPTDDKVYAKFNIKYYPHDNDTILNMKIANHSIPRLHNVHFNIN